MAVNWSFRGTVLIGIRSLAGVKSSLGVTFVCLALHSSFLVAETEPSVPGAEEVVKAIFANTGTTLPSTQNCGEDNISVGRYLERAMVTMEGEVDGAVLNARCNRVAVNQDLIDLYTTDLYPSRAGDALRAVSDRQTIYQCDLVLVHEEGERSWSRELRFLMYGDQFTAVEGSFRCLTSP